MEDKILKAITEAFPFKFEEIKEIYKDCKSFNSTIVFCKLALKNPSIPILDLYKMFLNFQKENATKTK